MFATKFERGSSHFFFEVYRSTLHGELKLKVTKVVRREKARPERSQITLTAEDVVKFQEAFQDAASFINNA